MDKFPAILGLVQSFTHAIYRYDTNERSLAGLWKSRLAENLVWKREWPTPRGIAMPYRSPTWSWAAWDGPIIPPSFDLVEARVEMQYLHSKVEPVATNYRLGAVKTLTLTIRARWRRVSVVEHGGSSSFGFVFNMLVTRSDDVVGMAMLDDSSTAKACTEMPLYAMQIMKQRPGPSRWEYAPSCLLLELMAGNSTFERVGVCFLHPDASDFFDHKVLRRCFLN